MVSTKWYLIVSGPLRTLRDWRRDRSGTERPLSGACFGCWQSRTVARTSFRHLIIASQDGIACATETEATLESLRSMGASYYLCTPLLC